MPFGLHRNIPTCSIFTIKNMPVGCTRPLPSSFIYTGTANNLQHLLYTFPY